MIVIPNEPFNSNSKAEHTLFRLLKTVFNDENYYAFYSVNLQAHPEKRFAEIDFLLLNPLGVFVLEVKGGEVSCLNGVWRFTSASGRTDEHKKSPFHQANTALQGLRQQLIAHFGQKFVSSICFGYGVVMPDCVFQVPALEWDKKMLCHHEDVRNIARWLDDFFAYWQKRNSIILPTQYLSTKDIWAIKTYIRPDFDCKYVTATKEPLILKQRVVSKKDELLSCINKMLVELADTYNLQQITIASDHFMLLKQLKPALANSYPAEFIDCHQRLYSGLTLLPTSYIKHFVNDIIIAIDDSDLPKDYSEYAKKLYILIAIDDKN